MDNEDYIKQLEERLASLEDKLNHIVFGDNNTITIANCLIDSFKTGSASEVNLKSCPTGTINIENDCNIKVDHCPTGSIINCNIEDAEDCVDELEGRMDELDSRIEEASSST